MSIEALSPADSLRLERNITLRRIRDSLKQLSAADAATPTVSVLAVEVPSAWGMWLRRLTNAQPWAAAVIVAQTAAREWNVDTLASDAFAVQEVADLLLERRPQWGEAALQDSLPYILEFCLPAGGDPRLKPIYESLFLLLAVGDQVSLPQAAVLLKVVDLRLQIGTTSAIYREMIVQLSSALYAIESPSVAPLALEALEVLVNAACPLPAERQEFFVRVASVFNRWNRRIDRSLFTLLRQLGTELGVADAIAKEEPEDSPDQLHSHWVALDGKRVAMYSLQESALRRAASVIAELCPRARVNTFHDHVGGSAALRAASATSDVFVIATAAAKHAATRFIDEHRPKSRPTLYARSQGSASMLAAIRDYIASKID